ncbi:MAG TPA: PIG-L deacetylase family protein [Actinomycetota bacterium]|nr:PIG-L deacetylase family protein [Actinomycetota bacterium]
MNVSTGRYPQTILGVWAHPDDEVFVAGGLLAAAARLGGRVVCAYATRGERGLQEGHRFPASLLPRIRNAELARGLAALGVGAQYQANFPDSGLERVPPQEGTGWVSELLDLVRPEIVVTFGPDGITGHPDHRVLSGWVDDAFAERATAGATLLHAAVAVEWHDRFVPALQEFNAFFPGYPMACDSRGLDLHLVLDAQLIDMKLSALRAHKSQTARLFRAFGDDFMRELSAREAFRIAAGNSASELLAALSPDLVAPSS